MDASVRKKYFRLYANCLLVKGYKRSIIYDLQTGKWDFIPNALHEILKECGGGKVSDCYKIIHKNQHGILNEYFDFLIVKEYIHFAESKREFQSFPNLDMTFEMPNIISNAVLDFDLETLNESNFLSYQKVILDLIELGCRLVQVRFFGKRNPGNLFFNLWSNVQDLDFEVEMILPHILSNNCSFYEQLCHTIRNINRVIIYNTPENTLKEYNSSKYPIFFSSQRIEGDNCCGIIDPKYFAVNPLLFAESLSFNSCLNKKVGIDINGFIKNCPSMSKIFSRVGERNISDIILDDEFQDLWKVKKDEINTCKLCEFRYMCTDCRAFVSDKLDKPFKCKYDPLTAEWTT